MRFRPVFALLAAVLAAGGGATPALAAPASAFPRLVEDPTAYVDPLIGSSNGGNTFPAPNSSSPRPCSRAWRSTARAGTTSRSTRRERPPPPPTSRH